MESTYYRFNFLAENDHTFEEPNGRETKTKIYSLLDRHLIFGLGSTRVLNRHYINDCVPLYLRMKVSAGLLSACALGMAYGSA